MKSKAGPRVTKTDMQTLNEYIKPIIHDGLNVHGLENLNAYLYGDEMAAMQNYPSDDDLSRLPEIMFRHLHLFPIQKCLS